MILLRSGDVVAFKNGNKYCYAIILTKIVRFGGNFVYAFHLETERILSMEELLEKRTEGFNAIVDFIFVKREKRLTKIGYIDDYNKFWKHRFFKATNAIGNQIPKMWFIYDENFKELKRVKELTGEEKDYPLTIRIDYVLLSKLVAKKWLPTKLSYWG